MNAIFMICLMAIESFRCDKAVSEQTNQIAHKNDTSVFHPYDFCKKFDCPSIDEPQCVRMRIYATGLSFYFIAMNKCEFKYLKCRNDVEGTIVPMKYCEHPAGQLAGKQTNETDKAHFRVKRRAHRARSSKPHLREAVKEESKPLVKVDMKQYEAACPTVCPSRDVMVCGICQHGIHRTFSSVCHMRMFGCNHPDEKMQLVSRRPCFMSAPFISEPGMQPHGRVTEPDDDDKLLRFIRCRDNGLQCPDDQKRKVLIRDDYTYKEEQLSFYKFHDEKKTWNDAKEKCEEEGASLYFPEDEKEHNETISFWKQHKTKIPKLSFWLGIKRKSNGSLLFETIDGRPLEDVYWKWRHNQPDNNDGVENCVHTNEAGYNDIVCSFLCTFICKF